MNVHSDTMYINFLLNDDTNTIVLVVLLIRPENYVF